MQRFNCLLLIAVAAVTGTAGPSTATAEILSTVPMQGGMIMPMLSYAAAELRLHVTEDPNVPQLTPLLVSNPLDNFDPADPWFDCLDPSRQGLSFSRRYGFVMDVATDPLPAGTAIWIRKLSGSPGLGAYRYRSSNPKAWEPIFGTGGAPDGLQWDGTMFHPGFTAPPGTNELVATFEAVLINAVTGEDVPNSGTGPFELRWTNVSDGRPELKVACVDAGKICVSWPAAATNYTLVTAGSPSAASWLAVTNTPQVVGDWRNVTLDPVAPGAFFRMRRIP